MGHKGDVSVKWQRIKKRVDVQASLICVLLVIGSSLTIFYINYKITYDNIIETLKTRTDAIYSSVDGIFNRELFDKINTKEDMETDIYKEYQNTLLEMRSVSNVRYLYTAKKNDQGQYIYLIDGLPLDSDDFRKPGELIEEDIHADIEAVYDGGIVRPDEILDTSWGKIFLAYYPIHAGEQDSGEVIGVIGIEIDAETQYNTYNDMLRTAPIVIAIACIIAFGVFAWCFRYISNPRRKDLYNIDALTKLKSRAALDSDFANIYMKEQSVCLIMIDLDHLKMMNDEYGHVAGDDYLRLVGEIIGHIFHRAGISYRFGGDEFVVVLDETNENKICQYIQKLQEAFTNHSQHLQGHYGLSIGYAIYEQEKDKTLWDALKRADVKMYQNKKEKYHNEG